MNCAEFQTRLNDDFEGLTGGPAADLAFHASECSTCRETYEGFRLLADGIGDWRRATPDVDLVEAVICALQEPAPGLPQKTVSSPLPTAAGRSRANRRSVAFPVVGAAVLLTVVSLLVVLRPARTIHAPVAQVPQAERSLAATVDREHNTPSADAGPDAGHVDAGHAEAGNPDNDETLPQVAQAASPAPPAEPGPYFDLAQRAAGAWGQMTMLVLPAGSAEGSVRQSPAVAQPQPQRSAGWIDDVERGLKPVGRGLDNAFDFLWRAGESAGG